MFKSLTDTIDALSVLSRYSDGQLINTSTRATPVSHSTKVLDVMVLVVLE